MQVSRRTALKAAAAATVPILGGFPAARRDLGTDVASVWITFKGLDGSSPITIGAIGVPAICCAHRILNEVRLYAPIDHDVTPRMSPTPDGARGLGVVLADAETLSEEPGWVDDVPDGWGWVLVPRCNTTDRGLLQLRDLVASRASWIAFGEEPLTGKELPGQLWPCQSGWATAPGLAAYLLFFPELSDLLRSRAPGRVIAGSVSRGEAKWICDERYFDADSLVEFRREAPSLERFLIHLSYHRDAPLDQVERHVAAVRRQAASAIVPAIVEATEDSTFAPGLPEMLQKLTCWIYAF